MSLDAQTAAPFRRALMRAEAEVLIEDADAVGSPQETDRTSEQRAADALVRIAEAMAP